jgi:hypothetical protein
MKHIKLFEGFNTDEYYQEVTNQDWNDYFGMIPRDDSGKRKIINNRKLLERIINKIDPKLVVSWLGVNHDPKPNGRILSICDDSPKYYGYSKIEVFIVPLEDEYFIVRVFDRTKDNWEEAYPFSIPIEIMNKSFKYYKCDQREGLSKLLKDKGIIK